MVQWMHSNTGMMGIGGMMGSAAQLQQSCERWATGTDRRWCKNMAQWMNQRAAAQGGWRG